MTFALQMGMVPPTNFGLERQARQPLITVVGKQVETNEYRQKRQG